MTSSSSSFQSLLNSLLRAVEGKEEKKQSEGTEGMPTEFGRILQMKQLPQSVLRSFLSDPNNKQVPHLPVFSFEKSQPNNNNMSALSLAIFHDHTEFAQKLITEYGVNPNGLLQVEGDESNTYLPPIIYHPLLVAARRGNMKMVQFLLENGSDPTQICPVYDDTNTIIKAFMKGFETKETNNDDRKSVTVFEALIALGELGTLKLILSANSDLLHQAFALKKTPGILASSACAILMLFAAIDSSIIDEVDDEGNTLLHLVAKREETADSKITLEYLIASGVDVNAKNKAEQTAFDVATVSDNDEIAALLKVNSN